MERAEQIIECGEAAQEELDWMSHNFGEVYSAAARDEQGEDLLKRTQDLIASNGPFTDISNALSGIVNGWKGWSAEQSNGMRVPEYVQDRLEYDDFMYYLPKFLDELSEFCDYADFDAGEMLDAGYRIIELSDQIKETLEPLLGRYGA